MDITERKRAETIADEHLRFQQILMDAIPIPVFFKDIDGKYLGCNEAFSKFLGRSKMEIVGKSVFDLSPKHLADIYHAKDIELLTRGGIQTYESRVRYADGTEHHVVFYKSTFPDVDGTVGGLIGIILDITDRTKSQIALQESEQRMRRIIDSSPVGIRITQDGRHVYANRALAGIFGYESQEEILGLPAEALFTPESRALIRQRIADRMAGKKIPHHYEASGMTGHGKTIALESWGTEIEYLEKKSWLAFIIDISEAKSLRAQLLQARRWKQSEPLPEVLPTISITYFRLCWVLLKSSLWTREQETGSTKTSGRY
jgi:PAS domain S-box-containing protein